MSLSNGMINDPVSGLVIPTRLYDEKASLKRTIDNVVEKAINGMGNFKDTYFLTIHAMFDKRDPSVFKIDTPKATVKLPQFRSNTLVYWVDPVRGFHELLWMVAPKKGKQKLKVDFNTSGVAYLQAKGAMIGPS